MDCVRSILEFLKVMKKVALVVNSLRFLKSHRLELINSIAEHYDVFLVTQVDAPLDGLDQRIKIIETNFNRGTEGLLSEVKLLKNIIKTLKDIKPDIIHTVTIKPLLYAGIASLFLPKVKNIFAISGLGLMFNSQKFAHKCVRFSVSKCLSLIERRRKCHFVFQNTNDKDLLEVGIGRNISSTMMFGSGVKLSKYSCCENKFLQPSVLFAGRLLKDKGVLLFLRLAKKYATPELQFFIAGEIDGGNPNAISSEELNSFITPDIKYLGFVDDMPLLLSQKAIFIYPSYYGEGIPKVMLEAATSGMPILTTDHPGCRDAVTADFALLCMPNDYDSLELKFKEMIADTERLKEMSNMAMIFASANFSVENIITKHLKVYSEI